MNKQFGVGNRVKYFEPVGRNITHGTIEEINEHTNRMSIREDGFDGKVLMGACKINDHWFAFSPYDGEYTLEIIPENKFLPGVWVKNCIIRKLKHVLSDLEWKARCLLKRVV